MPYSRNLNGRRLRSIKATPSSDFEIQDVAPFIIGAVSCIEFSVGGRLFATEVLLAGYLALTLSRRGNALDAPWPRRFLTGAALWLVAQIVTDLIRHSEFTSYSKGWAKIVFTITNFAGLYLLLSKRQRFGLYLSGLAVGGIVTFFVNPNPDTALDPWKWGLAIPTTYLAVVFASVAYDGQKKAMAVLALTGISLLNLYLNFRSEAMICFLAACCVLYRASKGRARLERSQLATCAALLVAAVVSFSEGYGFLAANGWLGRDALGKYENQASGDAGVLLGGRSESFASVRAILDSPIIGHGSNPKDVAYVEAMVASARAHGYKNVSQAQHDTIPAHSHVLGAWVESGIVGAAFWAFLFAVFVAGVTRGVARGDSLLVLLVFTSLTAFWDILFSPYTTERRFHTTFFVALAMRSLSYRSHYYGTKAIRKRSAHLHHRIPEAAA